MRKRGQLGVWALTCAAGAVLAGCSGVRPAHLLHAGAPGLGGDAPLSSRGGTNPNAPYTMVDHSARLVKRPTTAIDVNAATPCSAADLSLFESGAHVDGDRRSVRLNLVNHGKQGCVLSGYPAISLLRQDGSLIGSIGIEKVTATTMEAALRPQAVAGASDPGAKPSPHVLLAPGGEATFEVGWKSGGNCDQVGSIAVAAPGTLQTYVVRHELTVCEGRILVTAVSDGSEL